MGKIFSPGKLLLTSEYSVLDGALALAVPTKQGQEFFFEEKSDGGALVHWEALHQGNPWLKVCIDYKTWTVVHTNIPQAGAFVLKVLQNVSELSSTKFKGNETYILTTNLQFPPDYGLGSSSTLMNNLAEWAGTDAFILNDLSLGGSGYDIAVAKEKTPILFQLNEEKRISTPVVFSPSFKDQIIFIHLNQKQDSREGINMYRSKVKSTVLIDELTAITHKVVHCKDLNEFSAMMTAHEQLLSDFLNIPTAKEKIFKSCPSFIKSLGAWGGDFIMGSKFSNYQNYFNERNFHTIFSWDDLIG